MFGAVAAILAFLSLQIWLTPDGLPLFRSPESYWQDRHGALTRTVKIRRDNETGHRVDYVQLKSNSGLDVDLAVKRPLDGAARTTVIILGGHRTGRKAVHLLETTGNTNIVALDYPFKGNHRMKGTAVFKALPDIRKAMYDAIPAVMLAVDYLATQSYVDPERLELVGVSLGAPLVCSAGALDARIGRVWAIQGGGDLHAIFNHNLQSKISFGPARYAGASFAQLLLHTLAPEKWVGQIAPRSFIMINADQDERVPKTCVQALYDQAREPRELIWISDQHVNPKKKESIKALFTMVVERVSASEP